MDGVDPTPQVVVVPDHLRRVIGAAAALELEMASDGFWPDEDEERAARRDAIASAVRTIDAWETDACSPTEIARLARRAAREQEPDHWPSTLAEADDLIARAGLARDLLLVGDTLDAGPGEDRGDPPR
jgi:hypothetical protein